MKKTIIWLTTLATCIAPLSVIACSKDNKIDTTTTVEKETSEKKWESVKFNTREKQIKLIKAIGLKENEGVHSNWNKTNWSFNINESKNINIEEKNFKVKSIGKKEIKDYYINLKKVIFLYEGKDYVVDNIKLDSFKFQLFHNGPNKYSMKDKDMSFTQEWDVSLSNIDWTGVKGITDSNNPFQGSISGFVITNSNFTGMNLNKITAWPTTLSGITWGQSIGANITPFKGNLYDKGISIQNSILNQVDISQVEKWPNNLIGIDWTGVTNVTASSEPFKKDISKLRMNNSILNGMDISKVEKWPDKAALDNVNWTSVKYFSSQNFGNLDKDIITLIKTKGTLLT